MIGDPTMTSPASDLRSGGLPSIKMSSYGWPAINMRGRGLDRRMKSFNDFLEGKAIGGGAGKRIAGRAFEAGKDALIDAGAAVATGGMSLVPGLGGFVRAGVGGAGDLGRGWRERAAIKKATELVMQGTSQKATTRDPSLVQRTVDSFLDISDECLVHLTEKEQESIGIKLIQAIKDGSVVPGHAQRLANGLLTNKANQIMQAVSSSRSKVAV